MAINSGCALATFGKMVEHPTFLSTLTIPLPVDSITQPRGLWLRPHQIVDESRDTRLRQPGFQQNSDCKLPLFLAKTVGTCGDEVGTRGQHGDSRMLCLLPTRLDILFTSPRPHFFFINPIVLLNICLNARLEKELFTRANKEETGNVAKTQTFAIEGFVKIDVDNFPRNSDVRLRLEDAGMLPIPLFSLCKSRCCWKNGRVEMKFALDLLDSWKMSWRF